MRFVLYNIRYGTGRRRYLLPSSGYLRRTTDHMRKIIHFMQRIKPDIIGLVEVDAGSYRMQQRNQAELIAESLHHHHSYRSKYGHGSVARWLPLFSKQGNAVISRHPITSQRFHYLERGVKRLVMEMEVAGVTLFLVHLALSFGARHQQLRSLASMVRRTHRPCLVAGDFNAMAGKEELAFFLACTGLSNADDLGRPTFPSWDPRRHLDFILHNRRIRVNRFEMPRIWLSDHLPLICDFEIT
jgi:endonuclease/exonuclease/phosphatase family metal-dependent hydrolase